MSRSCLYAHTKSRRARTLSTFQNLEKTFQQQRLSIIIANDYQLRVEEKYFENFHALVTSDDEKNVWDGMWHLGADFNNL